MVVIDSDPRGLQALQSFEKLSPKEKAQLSSWEKLARDRLALEVLVTKLILELAES